MARSEIHKKFGARIQQLRKEQGLTQEDLADAIGVDRSHKGIHRDYFQTVEALETITEVRSLI